jgi:membrane protease YdiL (CAAX protease family)
VGLVWQFILVVILVYREAGNLRWAALKERLWLNSPRSPRTGEVQRKLWLWVIPLILVTAVYELSINDIISGFWTSLFPFLAEPPSFAMGSFLQSPESRAQLVGNWGALALFVVSAVFNTVLGEELLFRGLLLPRMNGRFGRWDWAANGLLFGVYHVHQPWNILNDAIYGCLFVGFPTKRFRSSWMGIVVHSGQSVFLTYLILGLVLGLA